MSFVDTTPEITDVAFRRARRSEGGTHGTVKLGTATLSFDDPAHARAVAAACIECADAMERLAAETGKDGGDGA